jgi:hypothetical protein
MVPSLAPSLASSFAHSFVEPVTLVNSIVLPRALVCKSFCNSFKSSLDDKMARYQDLRNGEKRTFPFFLGATAIRKTEIGLQHRQTFKFGPDLY